MKLLTFDAKGTPHVGAIAPEGVVDLTEALALTHPDIKERGSLLEIIRAGIDIDQAATQSIETLRRDGRLKGLVVADPKYLPPILRPSKILALALNFREDIGSVTRRCGASSLATAPANYMACFSIGGDRDGPGKWRRPRRAALQRC